MSRIKKLPEELEAHIWKDAHGFNLYKVNQKIKYERDMFGSHPLNHSAIYEFWFQLGLKELPKKCWKNTSRYHKRYREKEQRLWRDIQRIFMFGQ